MLERSPRMLARIPPRWALFSTAVLGMLGVSLWLRTTRPVTPPERISLPPSNTLAVLPFAPAGPDPASVYLGPGIADELVRTLGRVRGLRVAGKSSSFALADSRGDARNIGRRLGVGVVLDGTVRRAGDRLRVSARLLSVEEGFDLWSDVYDLGEADLAGLDDQIAQSVVATLQSRGALAHTLAPSPPPTRSPPAYEAYLIGRATLAGSSRDSVATAIALFSHAVALDSTFAPAHAALAEAYLRLGATDSLPPTDVMPIARSAALRALELDDAIVEAQSTLGQIRFLYEWNWQAAERAFRRALALNPNLPRTHHRYAHFLLAMGRPEEALAAARRALDLDPLDLETRIHFGWQYLLTRDYQPAREALRDAAALFPGAWEPSYYLGLVAQMAGDTAGAVAPLEDARRKAPGAVEPLAGLAWVHAAAGRGEQARQALDELRALGRSQYVSPCLIAYVYAALGQRRAAFAWLERAVRARDPRLVYLRNAPQADPLRRDRRYAALVQRVGLP